MKRRIPLRVGSNARDGDETGVISRIASVEKARTVQKIGDVEADSATQSPMPQETPQLDAPDTAPSPQNTPGKTISVRVRVSKAFDADVMHKAASLGMEPEYARAALLRRAREDLRNDPDSALLIQAIKRPARETVFWQYTSAQLSEQKIERLHLLANDPLKMLTTTKLATAFLSATLEQQRLNTGE